MKWKAYWQLARFHKPTGILLLWSPTAWALWIANQGHPPIETVLLFLLGTILMRAAGCVMNDIADRHIDLHVHRTKLRPLTSGQVSLNEAFILFFSLLFFAALILVQLPLACFYYGLIAVGVTLLYPFGKRYIHCPQLVLGIAFSLGIPMAFAASQRQMDSVFLLLLVINFAWIIAYDTQYAMADREDDQRIGVKSTAIFFAQYDRLIIMLLQGFCHFLWLVLAISMALAPLFYLCWFLAGSCLVYQERYLMVGGEEACMRAFSNNNWYGLLLWVGLVVGQ